MAGVIVPLVGGIFGIVIRIVIVAIRFVLEGAVPPPVVVAALAPEVVLIRVAAVRGQDIVEIEHGDIGVRIILEPVVDQPLIESPGVGCVGRIGERRGGDGDEELVLRVRK